MLKSLFAVAELKLFYRVGLRYSLLLFLMTLPLSAQDLPSFPWGIVSAPTESEQKNTFGYGFSVGTDYDDQLPANSTVDHDFIYSVQPNIDWQIVRRRWRSTLDYTTAFSYSKHRVSGYDLFAQSLNFDFGKRFTKRLALDVRNNFTRTSNPFDYLQFTADQPTTPVPDGPNTSTPGTISARRIEQFGTTLGYRLTNRSVLGIGGSFMQIDQQRLGDESSFDPGLRSRAGSGRIFLARQTGPRSLMGFGYTYQDLDFGHGQVTTQAHTLLYFWNLSVSPTLMISLFAGPAYSGTRQLTAFGPGPLNTDLSGSGGATLTWTTQRNELSLSATRRITDGSWVGGNVLLDSYSGRVKRRISAHLSIDGFVTYNRNHLLLPTSTTSRFDYFAAGGGLSRQLTAHTALSLLYWRLQQDDFTQPGTVLAGNRAGIRLSYNNLVPVGRR